MSNHRYIKRTCIYSFKKSLEYYGHISLISLASWSNKIPKEEHSNIKVRKTYNLCRNNDLF